MKQFALLLLLLFLATPILGRTPVFKPQPTCKDVGTIDKSLNLRINQHLQSLLINSTFLSVFKVALENNCPFWQEDGQCMMRECTVCNCPDQDVPPAWRQDSDSSTGCPQPQDSPTPSNQLNNVDRSLTGLGELVGPPVWQTSDTHVWTVQDDDSKMVYVDLRKNPERFTGYSGESSRRVWRAIYLENCFSFSAGCSSGICGPETCKEERVLYTLISGLHASISMHIAKTYLFGDRWATNLQIYRDRVRNPKGRVENLHLAYAIVMRAVSKASATLHPNNYSYVTGNDDNDRFTQRGMARLLDFPMLQPGCEDRLFDESDMFLQNRAKMFPEFRGAFRNISMIMDCVGCEKCRLWGKLQFLGLGTALRIIFEDDMPELQRNEVIALVNLFYKLSSSVRWVDQMEKTIQSEANMWSRFGAMIAVLGIFLLSACFRRNRDATSPAVANDTKDAKSSEKIKPEANGEKSEVSTLSSSENPSDEGKNEETSQELTPRRSERLRRRKAVPS